MSRLKPVIDVADIAKGVDANKVHGNKVENDKKKQKKEQQDG